MKTKALISCPVTVQRTRGGGSTTQVIWAIVFAYVKSRFSHNMAEMVPDKSGKRIRQQLFIAKNSSI